MVKNGRGRRAAKSARWVAKVLLGRHEIPAEQSRFGAKKGNFPAFDVAFVQHFVVQSVCQRGLMGGEPAAPFSPPVILVGDVCFGESLHWL